MTKLYKLSFGDHECEHIAGIFSTRELAIEAGDKIENILTKLNDMYKIKSFDDLPKAYQDIILTSNKSKELSQDDLQYFAEHSSMRRNITIKDSEEHQHLHHTFGNSFFYKVILPGYSIEEYTLDTVVDKLL